MPDRDVSTQQARESFEEYVAARRTALLRTAYLLTGQHADAEDLVQMALVKVVPHWRRISDDPEPYVRRILAREATNRWRRRRWREVSSDVLPETLSEGTDPTDREVLRQALMRLSPRQRAVVVLRYFDDLTEQQTAEVLGIGLGTVKSHGREAMARLRELITLEEPLDTVAP
ncbi:SigE family RNA polymerase sigma factor [uncultured Nocardioides sp.]|uniref:SigE family RNA polymerase sigma factor n=1 Tax=uncultured Nocardioides sp. TaxID=198441 RepID=UPI00268ED332